MLEKVREAADWQQMLIGIIIGLLISAPIQPYLTSFTTDVYQGVGAPGYQPPELNVELQHHRVSYPEGEKVPDFGNLSWQDNYSVYRVIIENQGSKIARAVEVFVPLPGCSIFTNEDGPSVGGTARVTPTVSARIAGSSSFTEVGVYSCSKMVRVDNLSPGSVVSREFVVTTKFEKCDLLLGTPQRQILKTQFLWEKNSKIYPGSIEDNIYSGSFKDDFDKFFQSSPTVGWFVRDDSIDMDLGIFIVSTQSDFGLAMNECGYQQGGPPETA